MIPGDSCSVFCGVYRCLDGASLDFANARVANVWLAVDDCLDVAGCSVDVSCICRMFGKRSRIVAIISRI